MNAQKERQVDNISKTGLDLAVPPDSLEFSSAGKTNAIFVE